jgi:hypothetical protein
VASSAEPVVVFRLERGALDGSPGQFFMLEPPGGGSRPMSLCRAAGRARFRSTRSGPARCAPARPARDPCARTARQRLRPDVERPLLVAAASGSRPAVPPSAARSPGARLPQRDHAAGAPPPGAEVVEPRLVTSAPR